MLWCVALVVALQHNEEKKLLLYDGKNIFKKNEGHLFGILHLFFA